MHLGGVVVPSAQSTQQGAQAEPSPTLHIANCCAIVLAMLRSRFGRLSTALDLQENIAHRDVVLTTGDMPWSK